MGPRRESYPSLRLPGFASRAETIAAGSRHGCPAFVGRGLFIARQLSGRWLLGGQSCMTEHDKILAKLCVIPRDRQIANEQKCLKRRNFTQSREIRRRFQFPQVLFG